MSKELYDVTLQMHHETEKACLMSEDGDEKNAKWLPKSQIEIIAKDKAKGIYEVTMPMWLAIKNGLV